MADHSDSNQGLPVIPPVYLSVPRRVILMLCGGAVAGALLSVAGAVLYSGGTRRLMLAYLVAFAFVLSLSLGSLFFVLIQHLMRAGWGVVVRRPAEIFSLNVITVALLFLPIVWSVTNGDGELYPWTSQDAVHEQPHESIHEPITPTGLYAHQTVDELTRSKQAWLNPKSYLLRACFFFAVWILIAGFFFLSSRRQDATGDDNETRRMERWAGVCTCAFAITLTYASFDLLMSLDPHWYSTIFGVYYFAGSAVGGISAILLSVLLLERFQIIPSLVSAEHRRDLGRLLFAFVMFWCYIAFSQYMLLWYANVPETTHWFVNRGASTAAGYTNSWGYLLVFLLLAHFFIPFLGIMSRHVKSSQRAMIFWTVWLLLMHYLDLYWLVMPELGPDFTIGLPELSTLLFVSCTYLLGASVIATRTSLIPTGDPRMSASVAITEAY